MARALLIIAAGFGVSHGQDASKAPPVLRGKGWRPPISNNYVGILQLSQQDRDNTPSSVDWQYATSSIKDQGPCGSCWAYATTEGIETAVYFKNGEQGSVPTYSEQQFISCDGSDGGCGGGNVMDALEYYTSAGGIDSQSDYEDVDNTNSCLEKSCTSTCSWDNQKAFSGKLDWYYAVPNGDGDDQDEEGLATALAKYGPLTISLNANWDNHADWHADGVYYGINDTCANTRTDHAVQLIGYDKNADPPYWKIRNSWGSDWGENGYIRIPYGAKNYCGVANEAVLIRVSTGDGAPMPIAAMSNATQNIIV